MTRTGVKWSEIFVYSTNLGRTGLSFDAIEVWRPTEAEVAQVKPS